MRFVLCCFFLLQIGGAVVAGAKLGGEKDCRSDGLVVAVVDACPTNGCVRVPGEYVSALEAAGHVPFVLPRLASAKEVAKVLSSCDLVLFCGGEDINPALYGQEPDPGLEFVNVGRDRFETVVFDEARKVRKPMFGICRGCQFVNCMFGGDMIQNIPTSVPRHILHRIESPRNGLLHPVSVLAGSRLATVLNVGEFTVFSKHHQAIGRVAEGFRVSARASDGIVEAIEGVDYPAAGVQFHPEMNLRLDSSSKLISIFRRLDHLCAIPVDSKKVGRDGGVVSDMVCGGLTVAPSVARPVSGCQKRERD